MHKRRSLASRSAGVRSRVLVLTRSAAIGLAMMVQAGCSATTVADEPARPGPTLSASADAAPTPAASDDETTAPDGGESPAIVDDEALSIAEAAGAVLAAGRFAFTVTWEDPPVGDLETLTSSGQVDLDRGMAQYQPLLSDSESVEVRIIGEDMYTGDKVEGQWQHSRQEPDETRPPDELSLMELMPYSGNPVAMLERLMEVDVDGTPTAAGVPDGMVCRDYQETTPEGAPHPFVACHRDGVLRWIQYPGSDEDGGPLTTTLDDIGHADVVVVRPTTGVTEFPSATDEPTEDVEFIPADG